jgi:hypothetical protein
MADVRPLLLAIVALTASSAKCSSNECDDSYSACEGDVMVLCDHTESGHTVLVRNACPPGELCVLGSFPDLSDPQNPIKLSGRQFMCAPDMGPDARCDSQASFCDCNGPRVCSDGHAVRILGCSTGGVDSAGVPDWICTADPSQPDVWPTCKRHVPGTDPGVDVSTLYCSLPVDNDGGRRERPDAQVSD